MALLFSWRILWREVQLLKFSKVNFLFDFYAKSTDFVKDLDNLRLDNTLTLLITFSLHFWNKNDGWC